MKKIQNLTLIILLFAFTNNLLAQEYIAPKLEFAFELKVTIDAARKLGDTSHGKRVIIPITGGTFEGPKLKGTVLNGGADYQYVQNNGIRTIAS